MLKMIIEKISLILLLFPFALAAQTLNTPGVSQPPPPNFGKERSSRQITKAENLKDYRHREVRRAPRLSLTKQRRTKEQQKLLAPNAADAMKYAGFLRQPRTGLIRLADDIGCHANPLVVRVDEDCLNSIPGGSFYSFREREYSSSALADIRFNEGLLISDGIYSQNVLVNLGNVPLETLTAGSDGMPFLTAFTPELNTADATTQYIKIVKGIRSGNYDYRKVFPAAVDTTYAMRLIAYRAKLMGRVRGFAYNILSEDDRSDLLLAFRIVRKDSGSVTLLWKELERKKAPRIESSHQER